MKPGLLTNRLRGLAKRLSLGLIYRVPPIPQPFNGKLLWVHPRARYSISANTFFRQERHVRKWLTERLKPGNVFFDVGAHHGLVSMWASTLVGESGRVYAFEPSPANLSIMQWHRRWNRLSSWVLVNKAICDESAEASSFILIDSGDSPMNSLVTNITRLPSMQGRTMGNITIETVSLDDFCQSAHARPDVLKIDVEGAELSVLRGGRCLLRESRPVIILAVHPHLLQPDQSTHHIMELLVGDGYKVFDWEGGPAVSLRAGEYLCIHDGSSPSVKPVG